MKFSHLTLFFALMLTVVSCQKEAESPQSNNDGELMTRAELDQVISRQMGDKQLFDWRNTDAKTIWSAAMQSDSILAIGYTVGGKKDISNDIHLINTRDQNWLDSRTTIEQFVLKGEQLARKDNSLTLIDIMPPHMNDEWPTINIQVTSLQTVKALLAHADVRYVEPVEYWTWDAVQRSGSGCNGSPDYGINASDYVTVSPNAKVPWNFYEHNIDEAWAASTGAGKKICIIDTGVSNEQDNLGSNYNSGNSNGRSIEKYSTKWSGSWWWASLDSPADDCGHGTSMSGTAAAPWSTDGNALGVAYNADLVSIRAVEDVIISSGNEKRGVRDALKYAGNRGDIDIVSMSIGTPFYSSTVADGVNYAYNRGVLIFSAAGTSLTWTSWYGVIFPATLSRTVAVTGVKEGTSLQRCATCHDGSAVDFVTTMERSSNSNRNSLGLAMYSDQPSYIGGSSVATATTAGIAALAWADNPGESRSQILQRLKNASQFYPSRSGSFGWGRIDAAQVVD